MIPEQWILNLPRWAKIPVLDQAIWQWAALGLALLLGWLMLRSIHRWIQRTTNKRSAGKDPASSWYPLLTPLSTMLVAHLIGSVAILQIGITGEPRQLITIILGAVFYLATAVAVLRCGTWVAEQMVLSGRFKPKTLDAHLTRTGVNMMTVGIAVVVLLAGAHALGVPVVPLLAGVGVGGLAVALAAQTTLENLIGGLTLFADRPVRVGDFCRYGDRVGTVEQIGLRSTRLRSLDRTVVSVPNAEFSKLQMENYTRRDQILMQARRPEPALPFPPRPIIWPGTVAWMMPGFSRPRRASSPGARRAFCPIRISRRRYDGRRRIRWIFHPRARPTTKPPRTLRAVAR